MRYFVIFIVFLSLAACQSKVNEISEFRGPDRSGIFAEDQLMVSWPENGPEEVFFIDSIGRGYGPPVISEDLMYFTGAIDSTALLFCFDLQGQKVWDLNLGNEWVVNYPGSRSSPTVVANLIYVGTGMGNLLCVDKNDKTIKWELKLSDYEGILPLFGHSESPLIYEDKVFWTLGGKEHNVVALDRFSGELLWSSKGQGERSAYNPPRIITSPSGLKILVTFSAYHMMGFDIETGDFLWSHEQDNFPPEQRKPGYGDTHANTVIYDDGAIYYAEGDGNCGVKLELSDDGRTIKELWRNIGFDSFMGGIIKIGDTIYGSGTAKPYLYAINPETGILSDSLKIGRGVVVAADNKIYFYNQRGEVHLVNYTDGKLADISSFRIKKGSQEHFSHPLFYKGIMYLRHGHVIMGFDV